MSDTNVFFSAVQSALDAHIERMVDARLKEILTTNKAYEMIMSNLSDRVTALENNPAIGVDTTLEARVVALEQRLLTVAGVITPEMIVESMNNAEWLWEKLHNTINDNVSSRVEEALDNHCETYDHDSYDTVASNWNDEDPADFLRESELHDQIDDRVNDTLRNATFSISI